MAGAEQRNDGYRSDTTANDRSRSKPLAYDRNQSQTTDSYRNRLNVLDEEEETEYERSFMSDTTSGQPEAMHSRVVPAAANWAEIEEEEDEADQSNFLADLYQRHASGTGTLFDPSAKKTPNPNTPCFAMFYDGECSGKCGRSHSAQAMLDLRDRQFRKFTNSKWVKPIWIQGEVDNL